jgi:hypothetical protein
MTNKDSKAEIRARMAKTGESYVQARRKVIEVRSRRQPADLISPEGLEADAVVPQCLDNQYVSDEIFQDMIRRGVDYRDRAIAAARERTFRTEFIRSLVYSSQVVIQRAYLKNSDFLYKNYRPENGADLRAFAELMRQHAIIPYLYQESSFTDQLAFNVRNEGDAAAKALLDEVGKDVRCVRLAVDSADNSRATDHMATAFGSGLTRLNNLGSLERNAMASELFVEPSQLQEQGKWEAFEEAIDTLSEYAFSKARELRRAGKKITRQDIYRDLFAAGDDDNERSRNVVLGRFKTPDEADPFLLELKKCVDLIYNVNLPDHLKRYTFTPVNMPSRMALQDAPETGFSHDQISAVVSNSDALDWIARSFMARTQSTMDLPLLSSLTMVDVLAIRQLPEWELFKNAQARILKNPLQCVDNLPAFEEAFDQFQRALSAWYNRTYQRDQTTERYCNFVSLALSIGGVLVVAGSHLGPVPHDLADATLPVLATALPRRIKGYAAKLMVGVYDRGQRRLDADRAYTIELMQTNEELVREDVVELLNSVTRQQHSAVPGADGPVADQGIQ